MALFFLRRRISSCSEEFGAQKIGGGCYKFTHLEKMISIKSLVLAVAKSYLLQKMKLIDLGSVI